MTLADLLTSLSGDERDFIAMADYGRDAVKHREQLDIVIACGGEVDLKTQYWFPYEVVELRKWQMEEGHEREFAACAGIVLKNILDGSDKSNDVETIMDYTAPFMEKLPTELQSLLNELFDLAIEKS
jgi:hypothetical protein